MAKPSKNRDRRAVVEQMRREQQRAERRRTIAIFSVVGVVVLVIIGLGAYPLINDSREQSRLSAGGLGEIGVPAGEAGCQEVEADPAEGNNDHRNEGEPISYDAAPPASGPHYPVTAPMSRKFYSPQDRPDLGYLVHNLEHGYTVLWYDETIAEDDDKLAQVRAIANQFPTDTDPEDKFIAAPWTAEDGEPFPEGVHVALAHWSMGGTNGNEEGQQGVRQYCAEPSGEAVAQFVEDYPFSDSPEPGAA